MVDVEKRAALIRLISSQPEYEAGKAIVSIREFFDGNDDLGSIGCNLGEHPGLDHFKRALNSIAARSDVDSVWLQIYDLDEGDWPFSENVLIFGAASIDEIQNLSGSLQPSEVTQQIVEWSPSRDKSLCGRHYINLWWD